MNKFLKLAIAILSIIALVIALLFISFRSSTGYVYTELESNPYGDVITENIWVVELEPRQIEGKTKAEIIEAITKQADTSLLLDEENTDPGTIYQIPLINRQLGTDFEIGDKVRIYWHGAVMQSLPGKIDGTVLMIKMGD